MKALRFSFFFFIALMLFTVVGLNCSGPINTKVDDKDPIENDDKTAEEEKDDDPDNNQDEEGDDDNKQQDDQPNIITGAVDISCMGPDFEFEAFILNTLKKLEAEKHPYTRNDRTKPDVLRDCSGMFHRVLKDVSAQVSPNCPDFEFATTANRSSRALGKWYNEKGNFVQIGDPDKVGAIIKPGVVLFFGQNDKRRYDSSFPIEDLFKDNIGINHMGVVAWVKKEADQVVQYGMFHGHGAVGTLADITDYHRFKEGDYMSFANGKEQLVGYAPNILTSKN